MKLIFGFLTFVLVSLLMTAPLHAETTASVSRPPQYVLLAFDGSLNLDMWNTTLSFARSSDVKFTYFISGVYFLLNSKKADYVEPTHGRGVSAIGWGGNSPGDLQKRVGFVNQAYDSGHEIASHVNGHFDGSTWSLAQWRSEFQQFAHLIFDVFRTNGMAPPNSGNPYHFAPSQVNGFRAPLLGRNNSMDQALREFRYVYDTSRTAPMNYWPQKLNGVWNFPLAEVRIAGTGKRTLSMDYNFYFAQSGGKPNPSQSAEYEKEMLETYIGYFQSNYYGNRAPVHIGHHFAQWNGGAYWRAMQTFARTVCGKPEVRCVNYSDLVKYMESLSPELIASYHAGQFQKMNVDKSQPLHMSRVQPLDIQLKMNTSQPNAISAEIRGAAASRVPHDDENEFVWKADEKEILRSKSGQSNLQDLKANLKRGQKLSLSIERKGREILKTSHVVTNVENASLILEDEDIETQALTGDRPEAHFDE